MIPPSEHLHWMYAGAFLLLGLCLLAQAIVGDEVWNRRPFRRYFWPGFGFLMGFLLWPAMFFPLTFLVLSVAAFRARDGAPLVGSPPGRRRAGLPLLTAAFVRVWLATLAAFATFGMLILALPLYAKDELHTGSLGVGVAVGAG